MTSLLGELDQNSRELRIGSTSRSSYGRAGSSISSSQGFAVYLPSKLGLSAAMNWST